MGGKELGPDCALHCGIHGALVRYGGMAGHRLDGIKSLLALSIEQVNLTLG